MHQKVYNLEINTPPFTHSNHRTAIRSTGPPYQVNRTTIRSTARTPYQVNRAPYQVNRTPIRSTGPPSGQQDHHQVNRTTIRSTIGVTSGHFCGTHNFCYDTIGCHRHSCHSDNGYHMSFPTCTAPCSESSAV